MATSPSKRTLTPSAALPSMSTARPGLGGEVDNPNWKGLWPQRKLYDGDGKVKIEVIKVKRVQSTKIPTGSTASQVRPLRAAATYLVRFWLGEQGFKSYLKKFKKTGA